MSSQRGIRATAAIFQPALASSAASSTNVPNSVVAQARIPSTTRNRRDVAPAGALNVPSGPTAGHRRQGPRPSNTLGFLTKEQQNMDAGEHATNMYTGRPFGTPDNDPRLQSKEYHESAEKYLADKQIYFKPSMASCALGILAVRHMAERERNKIPTTTPLPSGRELFELYNYKDDKLEAPQEAPSCTDDNCSCRDIFALYQQDNQTLREGLVQMKLKHADWLENYWDVLAKSKKFQTDLASANREIDVLKEKLLEANEKLAQLAIKDEAKPKKQEEPVEQRKAKSDRDGVLQLGGQGAAGAKKVGESSAAGSSSKPAAVVGRAGSTPNSKVSSDSTAVGLDVAEHAPRKLDNHGTKRVGWYEPDMETYLDVVPDKYR